MMNLAIRHLCLWMACCLCTLSAAAQSSSPSTRWHWDKGTIVVETPERPAGQQHALGLRAPKLDVVRVGFVGLGMRGREAVKRFTYLTGVRIVALCDHEAGRAEACQRYLTDAHMPEAAVYAGEKGYVELCRRNCTSPPIGTTTSPWR